MQLDERTLAARVRFLWGLGAIASRHSSRQTGGAGGGRGWQRCRRGGGGVPSRKGRIDCTARLVAPREIA